MRFLLTEVCLYKLDLLCELHGFQPCMRGEGERGRGGEEERGRGGEGERTGSVDFNGKHS